MYAHVRAGRAVAGAILAVAAVLAVPAPAHAACASATANYPVLTGTLQLSSAPASGVQLIVSGTGFEPRSTVCLDVAPIAAQLATVKTNRQGDFTTTITLPDLPLGQHIVRATGIARDGSTLILNTAFTNGYALPSTGARALRWTLFSAAVVGLLLILGFRSRAGTPRRQIEGPRLTDGVGGR
jgi:hypothetical protein